MSFGTRLKSLRESKGLNQKALGESSGLGQNTISNLEQGKRQPAWVTVQALAKALGESTDVFRDDAPEPPAPKVPVPEDPAEPPKKPRGRPRKPVSEKPPEPKRPRGRPRKQPL